MPTSRVVRIERIDIVGREQVSRAQVERALRLEGLEVGGELTIPDDERIVRVREQLRATGYFSLVNPRVRAVPGSRHRVVLIIELEERASISVTDVYGATSRFTPFHGGLEVVERNFLGRGIHLGGGFVWGTLPDTPRSRRQQAYRAFVEAPRLGSAPLGALGSAYFISAGEPYRVAGELDDPDPDLFRTFDYTRIGGVLGLTFPVAPQLNLGVDYRFEHIHASVPAEPTYFAPDGQVAPVDLDVLDGRHRLAAAHFSLAWDGRRTAAVIGKGGRVALDVQLSSIALGSEYDYVKVVVGGAYTFRLPWKHWLTPSLTVGQVAGAAPRFEQFFVGDAAAWTPGREQGLRYSTRNAVDVFQTGIDKREFGVMFGTVDLEYVWPLFRRARTRAVYSGDFFFSAGVFTLVGDESERHMWRRLDEWVVPVGFNANLGIRIDTAIGVFDISVGNVLQRVPL